MTEVLNQPAGLPDVLKTTAFDESQSIQVESNILDANSFSWLNGTGGTARFALPKKGTVLDSNSSLVFRSKWSGYDAATARRQLSFHRFAGGLTSMKNSRLYVNGKLVTETREVGRKLALETGFLPSQFKKDILDVMTMGDNRYFLNAGTGGANVDTGPNDGYIHIHDSFHNDQAGSKTLKAGTLNVEVSISLSSLFGILKDVQLPLSMMNGEVLIEIDFDGTTEEVCVKSDVAPAYIHAQATAGGDIDAAQINVLAGGSGFANGQALTVTRIGAYANAAAPGAPLDAVLQNVAANGSIPLGLGNAAGSGINVNVAGAGYQPNEVVKITVTSAKKGEYTARNTFEVFQPRLMLDFIHYDELTKLALQEQILGVGIQFPFREVALIKKTLPAIGLSTTQTQDLEIGFAGRQVMKIYASKLCNGYENELLKKFRSDKLEGEVYNLFINNKWLHDRDVTLDAEAYNHLAETAGKPFNCLPSTYEVRGVQLTGANNFLNDRCKNGAEADNDDFGSVRHQLQGRLKYYGFNLAKYRNGNDDPLNSVRVGSSPLVLRIRRNSNFTADDGTVFTGTAETMDSVEVDIWIEWVRSATLKAGEVMLQNY